MKHSGQSEDTGNALPKMVGTEYIISFRGFHHLEEREGGVSAHFLWPFRITSTSYFCQLFLLPFICLYRSGNICTIEYNLFLTIILHLQIQKTPLLHFRPQMLRMKFRMPKNIPHNWLCLNCPVPWP